MNSHGAMVLGDAISSSGFGSRHHAPSDSRLLMNLIKAERTYCGHLHASVNSAHGAASALSSWGTSETPDVADASAQLSDLLTACADVQSTHVAAIEGYRSALKDVADREASIRTVVRDRDILVSRLIKASQKSGSASSKKSPEERAEKVAKAQRELAACEEVLTHEEAALVGVKRRTFKEALTMRMKTMGDAGAAMVDAAQEAIMLLNDFDSSADLPRSPAGYNGAFEQHHGSQEYNDGYGHDPQMYSHDAYGQAMYDQGMYEQRLYGHEGVPDEQAYYNANEMPSHEGGLDDQKQYAVNHPSFENASVTPSQSASQIYQPAAGHRDSWQVPFPTANGTDAGSGPYMQPGNAQRMAGRDIGHDSDSDNDDEWQEAFHGQGVTAHPGGAQKMGEAANARQPHHNALTSGNLAMPAPHQLDGNAGTNSFFVPPQQQQNEQGRNKQAGNSRPASSPAPPLPEKDSRASVDRTTSTTKTPQKMRESVGRSKSKRESRASEPRELNHVPMPPVPSAPRFDASGINMGPIPSAPKLYMQGASGNHSSSDDGTYRGGANNRGYSSWDTRVNRNNDGDASSDGGHTARLGRGQEPMTPSKKGFFGKVGKLFRSSTSGPGEADTLRQEPKAGRGTQSWRTRTDSNVRKNQRVNDPASQVRKRDVLTGPIVKDQGDSSDDEGLPDPRHLVRNVNTGPPLWQSKASSDIGTNNKLLSKVPKPKSLKRTPSASVIAGPQSFRSQQESQSPPTSPAAATAPTRAPLSRSATSSTVATKKKKKKVKSNASVDNLASSADSQAQKMQPSPAPTSSAPVHSVTVPGDASSGIRRNDSLNKGTSHEGFNSALAKRSSKRLSQMSTQTTHSSAPKSGAMRPTDPAGKFATTSWIAKSNEVDPKAGTTESAKPAAANTAETAVKNEAREAAPKKASKSQKDDDPPRHVPQPSRTMSPPLKPALKAPGSTDLARSGSINSSLSGAGAFQIPALPAPVSAPPRVTGTHASQDEQSIRVSAPAEKPRPSLSLEQGKGYDGSGALDIPDIRGEDSSSAKKPNGATVAPRINMLESEPFKIDLEANRARTAQQERSAAVEGNDAAIVSPDERSALATFLSQQPAEESKPSKAGSNADNASVTRSTVRRATVGSGVMGPKNVRPPSIDVPVADEAAKPAVSVPSAPGRLSRSYSGNPQMSESSDDEEADAAAHGDVAAASVDPTTVAQQDTLRPGTPAGGATAAQDHTPDGSGVGSTVSRRKSVRMAPDVKFPPDTPSGDELKHRSKPQPRSSTSTSHSAALSSRIAPPPPAPPRLQVSSTQDRPVDLGSSGRERAGWTTRIGSRAGDSSSDDEDGDGDGGNSYAAARRGFTSASKSWSQAIGRPESTSSKKKKKPSSTSGKSKNKSGYNPAIPLPAGMEVVGRSGSFRRK